jgi:hypothetical protein
MGNGTARDRRARSSHLGMPLALGYLSSHLKCQDLSLLHLASREIQRQAECQAAKKKGSPGRMVQSHQERNGRSPGIRKANYKTFKRC